MHFSIKPLTKGISEHMLVVEDTDRKFHGILLDLVFPADLKLGLSFARIEFEFILNGFSREELERLKFRKKSFETLCLEGRTISFKKKIQFQKTLNEEVLNMTQEMIAYMEGYFQDICEYLEVEGQEKIIDIGNLIWKSLKKGVSIDSNFGSISFSNC